MNIPIIENLKQGQFSKSSIQKHYPEFYNYLLERYKDIHWNKFSELLYLYFHNMNDIPKCPVCGNPLQLINFSKGYHQYCSVKCEHSDPEYQKRIENANFKKYGVKNYTQTKEFREKYKQKFIDKYGVDNPSKVKEFQKKRKQTNLERYGVEYYAKTNECKEKIKQTNLERYGVECVLESNIIKEKIKQTNLERYGVEYASQSTVFRNKVKQTCLKKHGCECSLTSEEVKLKSKDTLIQKYGVDNIAKLEETSLKKRRTCLKKYGVENYSQSLEFKNKIKQIMFEKYGVESYFQSDDYRKRLPDILSKIYKTKRKNHSFNSSSIENKLKRWLDENNIEYKYQYTSKEYPFNCDFYFPKQDLYLEIQGYFTHGDHPYDPTNPSDNILLKKLQEYNHHNIVETWTIRDPLKRKIVKQNHLNWMEVFTNDINILIDKLKNVL